VLSTPSPATASATAPDGAAAAAVAAAAAAGRWADVIVPLERAVVTTCGSKSAKCAALATLAVASNGLFAAPKGAVVPFGAMEAVVEAGGKGGRFKELLAVLEDGKVVGAELEAACGEIRALIEGTEVPAGLVQQIVSSLGASSTPGPMLLAVRSSANVEDLAGMAAAGLYDSVVGVAAEVPAEVAAAVAE
ncbi:Phosphoglucan, water dikinase, chloroplastic, partial [Tetrabaena socialis]